MKQADGHILKEVIEQYKELGDIKELSPYGNGHINNTYLTVYEDGGIRKRAVLQQINTQIFKNPVALMENISRITEFLKEKIKARGGDPKRETLNLLPTGDGFVYFKDSEGGYWRMYGFVEGASCYDRVEKAEDFYQSGLAFGNFQFLLSDFNAELLHETIPDFHNTMKRYEVFLKAVEDDVCGRAESVQTEIAFVKSKIVYAEEFDALLRAKELPIRVTHNDTKLNNIMIDDRTGQGICVIDLDTVMPGLSLYDFGDSIRFGANTAAEDEQDLSKVSCSLEYFEAYTKGFLKGCKGSLTDKETDMLVKGALVMTFECGMRFLTDYLQGDVYFKTAVEKHNLYRTRTQFRLIEDMEKKYETLQEIVKNYRGEELC